MKNLVIFAIALMAPALASAADTLNDAQIAAIVVAANQIDIEHGKLAESKSSNEQVKAFAHRMISDHGELNRQATELATKLKITPEENTISKAMRSDAKRNQERLNKLSGKEFDKMYIHDEVAFHQQVIDTVGAKLLPSVKNEELKALLAKAQPILNSHLNEAQRILSLVNEIR